MSRVLWVLEMGGDNENPNKRQPGPTRKTMVVLKDVVMSLADGGESAQDRDRNCNGSHHSECENDGVVEREIDEEAADGVDKPKKACDCTPRMNAANVLENGCEEDAEAEWGPLHGLASVL